MKAFFKAFLAVSSLFLAGCGPMSDKAKSSYMQAFHNGQFLEAEQVLEANNKRGSSFQKNRNALWFALENGTLDFINAQNDQAIDHYKLALEASDYFLQEDTAEKVQKLLLSDEASAFEGEDFEQVLLRVYFAFALLQKGETSNGLALLKQTETYQQLREEIFHKSKITENLKVLSNPFSKYLLALFLERSGDYSNSKILYQQAKESLPYPNLPDLNFLFPDKISKNTGTVLVICHNGNSPYRVSSRSKATEDTLAITNLLLTDSSIIRPALSSIPLIPVPELKEWPNGRPQATSISIGKERKRLIPIYNVNQIAHEQLELALPLIKARATARYLIREASVQAAKKSDANLGAILDIASLFANIMTKADTRTWMTLPSRFDVMRFELAPGQYPLIATVDDTIIPRQYTLPTIEVRKNRVCIVHLFNIHPGVFRYLVPQSFIFKENTHEKN